MQKDQPTYSPSEGDGDMLKHVKLPPRYVPDSVIGKGTDKIVLRAHDSELNRDVAIKLFREAGENAFHRAQMEFRMLFQLHHPALAEVYDLGLLENDAVYFTEELLVGTDVFSWVSKHRDRVAGVLEQIATGLDYLHEHGAVHGDIKPANIIIIGKPGGEVVKLIDFGLTSIRDTASLAPGGSPAYMAPELFRGDPPSAASDLYAFGCVWYELLTGRLPFASDSAAGLVRAHLSERPVSPSEINPEINRDTARRILRLLSKDPSARPASAMEAVGGASVASPQPRFSIPLQFREAEMKTIRDFLKEVSTSVLRIVGEPGSGRSELVREARVIAQVEGLIPVDVRPKEFAASGQRSLLAYIERKAVLAGIASSGMVDGTEIKIDSTDADIAERLTTVAAGRHFIVFIDDADDLPNVQREGLSLLARMAAESDSWPKMVLSYRTTKDDRSEYIVDIRLRPLSMAQVERVISTVFHGEVDEKTTEYLASRSAGLPGRLFLMIRQLFENRLLQVEDGKWVVSDPGRADHVADVILQELREAWDEIHDTAREYVRLVALTESGIPFRVLTELVGVEFRWDDVAEALSAGFLVRSGDQIRIRDEFARTVSLETCTSDIIESLRRRLLSVLRERSDAESLLEAGRQSEKLGDHAPVLYVKAARKLMDAFRYEDAEPILSHVLDTILETNDEWAVAAELLLDVYHHTGAFEKSAEIAERLVHVLEETNRRRDLVRILNRQAENFGKIGMIERAVRTARRAEERAREIGDVIGEAEALVQRGLSDYRQGNYHSAIELYEHAIGMYEKEEALGPAANVLLNAGFAATFCISPEKGKEYFEKARQYFAQEGDRYGLARALGNLGVALYLMSQYEEALHVREEAYRIFQELKDLQGQANAEVSIGRVLLTMGRFAEAERHLRQALRLMRATGDRVGEARCLENIGFLAVDTGRYEQALDSFTRAQGIARALNHTAMVAGNLQNEALVHFYRDNLDEAERCLHAAEDLAPEIDDDDVLNNLVLTSVLIASRAKHETDLRRGLEKAEELARKSLESNNVSLQVLGLILKARIHRSLDEAYAAYGASSSAMEILERTVYIEWPEEEVMLEHAFCCQAVDKVGEATETLRKAYDLLQQKADTIPDVDLRERFLKDVPSHATITGEYARFLRHPREVKIGILQDRALQTLYKVAATVNSILDPETLLPKILDMAIETMHGERGMVFLKEDGELMLKVARNVDQETIQDATEISRSIIEDVFMYGKPLVVNDALDDDDFKARASVRNFRISTIICVPLRSRNNVVGTVYIDRRESFKAPYLDERQDLAFLEAFANLAAIAIENARLHQRLKEENITLRRQVEERFGFANIIGNAPAMRRMYRSLEGAIRTDSPVLITGESGTGKELVAKAIHYQGRRKDAGFIAVDCGALPETLLESELFGHAKGAFTGAASDRKGLFEEADRGTIFLDEISNTSPSFQAKLLRVLQEGEIRRVGETKVREINVRVVAASNTEIEREVREGRFRQDLYYRLNVIPIFVPPLRERREDIPLLVHHFIKKYSLQMNREAPTFSESLVNLLVRQPWPGNVRELENVINRLLIFCDRKVIKPEDFKKIIQIQVDLGGDEQIVPVPVGDPVSSNTTRTLEEVERSYIIEVLRLSGGNKAEAARRLGLKRTTFLKKMKRLGIE